MWPTGRECNCLYRRFLTVCRSNYNRGSPARIVEMPWISISAAETILSQLSRGAVKVSFGELRMASAEVFSTANDRDRVLVSCRWPKSFPD